MAIHFNYSANVKLCEYLIICITSDHTIEKGEEKRYKRCQRILLGQVYIKEITSQNVRKLKLILYGRKL